MKSKLLFLTMAAILMAASVGLTSCKKDDGDAEPAKSDLMGTWICVENNELQAALTFSNSGKNVLVYLEGGWFDCSVERTPDSMTLTGRQVRMASFTDYGNYLARVVRSGITITFSYAKNGQQLDISNVVITPKIVYPKSRYILTFDKVYSGQTGVIY